MTETPKLDRVGLVLDGVSNEQRLDMWADLVRPMYNVSPLANGKAVVDMADAWLLDNLVLTRVAYESVLFVRDKKHIDNHVSDCLLVQLFRAGEHHLEMDGQSFIARPGDMCIRDFSRPSQARGTNIQVVSVLVAHDLVGYDRSRHPAYMSISQDGVMGRVLRNTLIGIFRQVETITKAEQSAIAGGLVGLLRGAFFAAASDPTAPAFVAARRQAIRDHIAQNLQSDQLTADAICAEFGLSRSSLYRELEPDGGLHRYITARRLNAALTSLAFTEAPRGAVSRAADAWGFSSVSHFSREFQRKFGFSPGSIVGTRSQDRASGDISIASRPDSTDLLPFLKKL